MQNVVLFTAVVRIADVNIVGVLSFMKSVAVLQLPILPTLICIFSLFSLRGWYWMLFCLPSSLLSSLRSIHVVWEGFPSFILS